MKIQDLEFPDHCPSECPFRESIMERGQSAICFRCPILCCKPSQDENEEPFVLVEPDDYRKDWLLEWYRFFKEGKQPELKLKI